MSLTKYFINNNKKLCQFKKLHNKRYFGLLDDSSSEHNIKIYFFKISDDTDVNNLSLYYTTLKYKSYVEFIFTKKKKELYKIRGNTNSCAFFRINEKAFFDIDYNDIYFLYSMLRKLNNSSSKFYISEFLKE